MKVLGKYLAVVAVLAVMAPGLTVFNATASAQTRSPIVMVAGDDADKETIPRGNDTFNRTQRAIAERLRAGGFRVYDETDVIAELPPARTGRPVPKLLEGAKASPIPVDLIVVTRIYASARPEPKIPGAFRPFIRIDARYLRARGGEPLGDLTLGPDVELPLIEGSCMTGEPPGRCLLQRTGDSAERIGRAVGDALAVKFAELLRRN
jgi:hypothetical protein